MERRELVKEAIKANINAPSRTIARMLHEKYPEYSVDSWRNIARTLRGNNGENKRKQLKDKSLVRPNQNPAVGHPFALP